MSGTLQLRSALIRAGKSKELFSIVAEARWVLGLPGLPIAGVLEMLGTCTTQHM